MYRYFVGGYYSDDICIHDDIPYHVLSQHENFLSLFFCLTAHFLSMATIEKALDISHKAQKDTDNLAG